MRKNLAILLAALIAVPAGAATNYVYDNGATPTQKFQRKPVQTPAQEVSADEFNQVTGALKDLRTAINETTPYYNVKRYGAKGDGATDDTVAIQAALDAAGDAGGGQVWVPRGTYIIGGTLRIRDDGVRLVGESKWLSKLKRKTGTSGWILAIGPEPTAFPSTSSLVTGSGVAMNFSDDNQGWLNLNAETQNYSSLEGRTAWTVEFFYRPAGTIAQIRNLISAALKRSDDEANQESFSWFVNADASVTIKVDINGVVKTCSSAAAAVATGVTKHMAITYDNTNIKMWIAGAQACSVAATGATKQKRTHHMHVGPYSWELLDNNNVLGGPLGAIDSIRLSANTRYTGAFTPSTSKFAYDNQTIFLTNFDDVSGMLVGAKVDLDEKTAKILWYSDHDPIVFGSGGGAHSQVRSLYFDTGGLYARASVHLGLFDLQFAFASTSIALQNNCFLSTVEEVNILGNGSGVNIINTHASGVNTYRHVYSSSAEYCMWIRNSGVELSHLFLFAATKIPLMLLGGGGSSMTALVQFANISDEAASGMETNVLIDNAVTAKFVGGTLEAIVNTMPNVKISGDKPVFFSGTTFNSMAGTTERIDFLGTRTVPVIVEEPAQWLGDTTIPWSVSDPTMVVRRDGGKYTSTRGISATATPANNLRGSCTLNAGSASVTCTFATAEADSTYFPVVTPVTVSGGAAAGSWRVKSIAKNAGNMVITTEADPGGAESVVFNYVLVR